MYSVTPHQDLDEHSEPRWDWPEPPAAPEPWSLSDFADILAGAPA